MAESQLFDLDVLTVYHAAVRPTAIRYKAI